MSTQTQNIIKEMESFVKKVMIDLATDLTEKLREKTPKDTTFASINWLPNVGTPFLETAGTRAEAVGFGLLKPEIQASKVAEIKTSYTYPQVIHVTNNVDYILDLNNGTSGQAPRAFVQIVASQAINRISGVKPD